MLPRLIVVDRRNRQLDFYRWRLTTGRYFLAATYTVTVGRVGARTPHGLYFVQGRSRTPDWMVPESPDYAPETWGTIYKFGEPGNPFDGGFVSLSGDESGIGIHGTVFDPQIGTASSHGCIRMLTGDFLEIYSKCKNGTPVYLH